MPVVDPGPFHRCGVGHAILIQGRLPVGAGCKPRICPASGHARRIVVLGNGRLSFLAPIPGQLPAKPIVQRKSILAGRAIDGAVKAERGTRYGADRHIGFVEQIGRIYAEVDWLTG